MKKITIPLSAFEIEKYDRKACKVKREKITLNPWINIHGLRSGRSIANSYKRKIQKHIKPIVEQAMIDGLEVNYPAKFRFDWFLADKRTDLDNWGFTHKFIFDAFQDVSVRGKEFMPNDNLKHVIGTLDYFAGVDKDNPRVEVTIIDEGELNG